MHAKTLWDVLFAGLNVMVGVMLTAGLLSPGAEGLVWYQRLGFIVASLAYISYGLYILTSGFPGSGYLMGMAIFGWIAMGWPGIVRLVRNKH